VGLTSAIISLVPIVQAVAEEVQDAQWQLAFLDIPKAQEISRGDGVQVAVVDTGVQADHPDLRGRVLPGIDLISGGNGWLDANGHGTQMAGFVAAAGRAVGVAPAARILPVTAGTGVGANGGLPKISEAIRWATDNGARVICVSLGQAEQEDSMQQATKYAIDHDVIVVAAVGNRPGSTSVEYPAAYAGVIAAAGVDRNGNHADVSVTGPQVVLSAPAVDVITTTSGSKYGKATGTSAATAIIAGVAALVRSKYPNLSGPEVVRRLTATATDKGPPGRDNEYGYGIVNPVAALTADVAPLPTSAAPSPEVEPSDPGGRSNLVLVLVLAATALLIAGVAGAAWFMIHRRS
jgi:type VII secretion-associated serine protease mycosin